jgi:hypothetical protein
VVLAASKKMLHARKLIANHLFVDAVIPVKRLLVKRVASLAVFRVSKASLLGRRNCRRAEVRPAKTP